MGLILALLLQDVEIDAAVRKATAFVKAGGKDDLALWTLVHVGVSEHDAALQALLGEMLGRPPETVRSAALQAKILADLEPARYRQRIAHGAQLLVDVQCGDGLWGAGVPVEAPDLLPQRRLQKFKIRRRAQGPKEGDVENARWAAWGLLAAHDAGMVLPAEVVEKAAAAWRLGEPDPAAQVSGLVICLYLQGKDWRKDRDVQRAVERLALAKRTDPASLYGLKRAMMHFGSDVLGGETWWKRNADLLLPAQKPDGSWGDVETTCYAALALHYPRHVWWRR